MSLVQEKVAKILASMPKRTFAVAELSDYGAPIEIINKLENSLGVIWIDDLLEYSPQELRKSLNYIGETYINQLLASLHSWAEGSGSI